ncbi:RNA polymerase sigma factor [Sulfuriferula multivorans]|uniref:RNA polymerase sigma factor n=1 Tax=Sulfuriferula multivorans TaxID=1559896 RepID=UPI000F5B950C|nr:sigma-70 family RNA polymerase sigma factor [Sulfuriferula multivorans]
MSLLSLLIGDGSLRVQLKERRTRLYRVAYSWCHDRSLADDLVQEALTRGLARLHQLRDPAQLDSWLFKILHNCWRDCFRCQKTFQDVDELEDHHYAHDETPEHIHSRSQIVDRVRAAVAQLPIGQRQVLTLIDLEGFSYNQVAEILEIPVGTVMSRLCRGRQSLKAKLVELSPQIKTGTLRSVK